MRRKWMPIGGLLLLSLLWAVGWLRADLSPGSGGWLRLNPLWQEAALLGVFAVATALGGVILKRRWPTGRVAFRTVLAGFGLFVVPAVLGFVAGEWIDGATRVALFSLTPLFAVIFEPHIGSNSEKGETRGAFAAAMIAVAGTFLIFPFELPHSYASAGAILGVLVAAGSVAAANCLGVELVQQRGICRLTFAAVACGSASILLAIAGSIGIVRRSSPISMDGWAVSDLVGLALLFWLMRRMSAVQMTTRFLIAPLLANLMTLALIRPHVEVQSWIGLLLIAQGAGWLVFAKADGIAASGRSFKLD